LGIADCLYFAHFYVDAEELTLSGLSGFAGQVENPAVKRL
jgi:hypothetical protein